MGTSVCVQTKRSTDKVEYINSCVIAQWEGSYATLTARVYDTNATPVTASCNLYGKIVYPDNSRKEVQFREGRTIISGSKYMSSKYYSYSATSMVLKNSYPKLSVKVKHN